jgi:hypothetical protein
MTSKVLVIIATAEKEKALTGLMYATNAMKYGWMDDVKTIFFGPAQNLMVTDAEVSQAVQELAKQGETVACKFIADRDELSDSTAQLGVQVEYVGTIISDLVKDGYVPMVW